MKNPFATLAGSALGRGTSPIKKPRKRREILVHSCYSQRDGQSLPEHCNCTERVPVKFARMLVEIGSADWQTTTMKTGVVRVSKASIVRAWPAKTVLIQTAIKNTAATETRKLRNAEALARALNDEQGELLKRVKRSFEGHPIHVPWDMWVSSSNTNALTIIRQAPQYSWTHSPSGILLFVRDQGAPTSFSKNYERIAATNGSQKGYRFQDLQKLEGQKGSVFCWELSKADSSSITISCHFDHDTLSASYDGSPMYRAGFYEAVAVIAGARSEQR
jgi:hypothetical protein